MLSDKTKKAASESDDPRLILIAAFFVTAPEMPTSEIGVRCDGPFLRCFEVEVYFAKVLQNRKFCFTK